MAQIRDYTSASTGSIGSYALATPAYQPGDILIALHSCDVGGTAQMTISGSGWSDAVTPISTSGLFTRAWVKTAGASEPSSFTFGQASTADGVIALVSLPAGQFNIADSWGDSDTNGDAQIVNIGSPAAAGDVILAWAVGLGSGSARTWTEPAGWTPMVDRQSGTYTVACLVSWTFTSDGDTGLASFVLSSGTTQAHTLKLRIRNANTSVAKSGSDSAAVSEQASMQVVLSRTDSAAVTDSGQAARLVADQASVTETQAISGALGRTDTVSFAEAATTSAAPGRADAGVASDSAQLSVALERSDGGVLAETARIEIPVTDGATLAETAAKQETLGPVTSDMATLAETAAGSATAGSADAATVGEAARVDVLRASTDSAALVEEASAGPKAGDAVVVNEMATVTVLLNLSDGAAVADTASAAQPVAATDSAALVETALVVEVGRAITGVDGPRRQWGATTGRRLWSADLPRRYWCASQS